MMINLELPEEKIHCGNLLLVNSAHPLKNTDENGLMPALADYPDILLKREAANVLQLLLQKTGAAGKIVPVSGYRSVCSQTEIYEDSLRENGEEFTAKYVALPFHSEHQTGLAIDLGLKKEKIDFIRPDLPYEGICGEFRSAAPRYGFIERYPRGRENITGIAHEPWHFRYVGYPHSEIMSENGLTLEEYTEYVKQFTYSGKHLKTESRQKSIEIFYLPGNSRSVSVPEKSVCQISGNNSDGFIATLWRNRNER